MSDVSPATHRRHYSISFKELAIRLGVEGDIFRVWSEDSVDYLHMLVFDPSRETVLPGGYAEDECVPPRMEYVSE